MMMRNALVVFAVILSSCAAEGGGIRREATGPEEAARVSPPAPPPQRERATPPREGVPRSGVVHAEGFENGTGRFSGGQVTEGGANGSKALAVPPGGVQIWRAYSTPVGESTRICFKAKPLVEVERLTILVWSEKLKDNGRYFVEDLRKGEWKAVEFKAKELITEWDRSGTSLQGDVLDNFKLLFEGEEAARVLLDDFEVRE